MQRVLIAGFGFMGSMHAQVYQQLLGARVVGIVDDRLELVRERLGELGVDAPVFKNWDAAVREIEFDVLDVCMPTYLHLEYARLAAGAGKALFCEKPLALTGERAREIARLAREAGISGQVGHCLRFWPEYVALRDYIKGGRGGKLLSLTMQRRSGGVVKPGAWFCDPERAGGAALDLHIHDADLVLWLFGKPEAVSSRATFDDTGPSHIFTDYLYKDVVVQAEGGWNYPGKWGFQMAFQALFENAAIEFDSRHDPSITIMEGDGERRTMETKTPGAGESKVGAGNIDELGGYYNELAAFINCLETGQPVREATLEQGAESVALVNAEVESARLGRPVRVGCDADGA